MPTAMLRPCPSEPLETSTPGSFSRCGCPWNGEYSLRSVTTSSMRKVAGEAEPEIQRRSLVSGGPDDAIAIGPVGNVGIVIGDLEIQRGDDVHHGERAAGMAGAGGAKRDQVIAAHQAGGMFEFFDGEIANNGFRESVDEEAWHSLAGQDNRSGVCMQGDLLDVAAADRPTPAPNLGDPQFVQPDSQG